MHEEWFENQSLTQTISYSEQVAARLSRSSPGGQIMSKHSGIEIVAVNRLLVVAATTAAHVGGAEEKVVSIAQYFGLMFG
jgi:hypothetical protein